MNTSRISQILVCFSCLLSMAFGQTEPNGAPPPAIPPARIIAETLKEHAVQAAQKAAENLKKVKEEAAKKAATMKGSEDKAEKNKAANAPADRQAKPGQQAEQAEQAARAPRAAAPAANQPAPKPNAKPKEEKKPKEDKALAALKKELAEIESVLSGDDESENSIILKKVIKEFETNYLDNHSAIIATREGINEAVEPEEFDKLIRQQKILAQRLIELDSRKVVSPNAASEIIRKLSTLQNNPIVRKDQNFRNQINQLRQRAYEFQNRSHRQPTKKTIEDITKPLVGKNHLGLALFKDRHNYPYAGDGLMQQWRIRSKKIVRLKWLNSRLQLDRGHWDTPFAGKTEEDIENEVASLLAVRGFKQNALTDPRQMRFRPSHYGQTNRPNLARLFATMQTPNYRSSSWGGNQQAVQMQFSDQQRTVKLKSTATAFNYEFAENDERGALLRVRDSDGRLTIESLGDVSLRFRQLRDDSVEIVEIADDDTLHFKADSFVEFYRKNVEYCELRFLPLLDYLGITPPISRLHPNVVKRVVNELYKNSEYRIVAADELIRDLSSEEYSRRELAAEKLRENVSRFAPALKAALRDGIPVESRMRIKSLLHEANRSESDELVAALKLLDDAEYLKVVQARVEDHDQQVVVERIQKLQLGE